MRENEVKIAFDKVEPETGAQARMYANILKKAAAQKENQAAEPVAEKQSPAPPKRRRLPAWQRWGSLAACLVLMIAAGLVLHRVLDRTAQDGPPTLATSPFEYVAGPEGFAKLGFSIDAPVGAEDVYYCIYNGEVARVDFTLDGHAYSYEAAKLDGNFSRVQGEADSSTALGAEYDAVLDHVPPGTWRAHWSCGGVRCYLTNSDGADEAAVTAAADALLGQNEIR